MEKSCAITRSQQKPCKVGPPGDAPLPLPMCVLA